MKNPQSIFYFIDIFIPFFHKCKQLGLKALLKNLLSTEFKRLLRGLIESMDFGLRRPKKAAFRPCSGLASRKACVLDGRLKS